MKERVKSDVRVFSGVSAYSSLHFINNFVNCRHNIRYKAFECDPIFLCFRSYS